MADPISSPLRLALIGMSGTGKTFWSKRLAQAGRPAFCCDDGIEQRLRSRLHAGGYARINGVASCMGWPASPTYPQPQAEYPAPHTPPPAAVPTNPSLDPH